MCDKISDEDYEAIDKWLKDASKREFIIDEIKATSEREWELHPPKTPK